jgi:hypothetical protein
VLQLDDRSSGARAHPTNPPKPPAPLFTFIRQCLSCQITHDSRPLVVEGDQVGYRCRA